MSKSRQDSDITIHNFLSWCIPLLTDTVGYEYAHLLKSKSSTFAIMTMLHTRTWTRLIEDDKPSALNCRRQLLEIARQEGISQEYIELIDGIIFDRVNRVISRRTSRLGEGRDPQSAALFEIAVCIGEFRALLHPTDRHTLQNSFQRILGKK